MPPLPLLAIANPDSKRWQLFARELADFQRERGLHVETFVIPWRDVVAQGGNLDGLPGFERPGFVRLESPGREFEVTRLLLEAGARGTPDENAVSWRDLPFRKGWLGRPGLYYRGFRRVLEGMRAAFDSRPHLVLAACPLAIAEMFDKRASSARMAVASLPCPRTLPPPASGRELLRALRDQALRNEHYQTAYVKLNTGSSATGIAVVHARDEVAWATTSMVHLGGEYFNTRRLQRVEGAELEAALDFLLREGAFIQQGIPMAQIDGQNFDVRVVVIHGKPAFTIFRLSNQPMTNLHLGGRRGDSGHCRACIPTRAWLDAVDHAVAAAGLYRSDMVGVDLVFERSYRRHHLLEVNAFGDFFPGLKDERGRSVHRAEIEEMLRRVAW